jgi:hypothetical protein
MSTPTVPQVLPPSGGPRVFRDFFSYTITFAALAAAVSADGQIQIQADSDFELQKWTYFADIAAAVQTESSRVLPLVTLQVTDQGVGRQMFSAAAAIPAIMGDGRIPFILPTTKVFNAKSTVLFTVANFSAATTYNLRLVLLGAKIFR